MDPRHMQLAARFMTFVEESTGLPMIVCDETGTIVQSRNVERLGTVHAFAKRIVNREADEIVVTAEDAAKDPRMKEGCSVALDADGVRLGTFGITGPLALSRPLARVAGAVFASWLQDQALQLALTEAAARVFEGVQQVSARTQLVATETDQVLAEMTRASREALDKLQASGQVTRTVQTISQKSRILSLNGSMEASRSGLQGRPFGVIAREMLELSESARAAAGEIEVTLGQVTEAIGHLSSAIARSSALATTQATALADVKDVIDGLRQVVERLTQAGGKKP